MEKQRPHGQAVIRHVDFLPMVAVVGAAVGAYMRAHVHDFRLLRVDGDGPDGRRLRQAAAQGFPLTIANGFAIQAGLNDPARRGFTGQAGIYVGPLVGCLGWHGMLLLPCWYGVAATVSDGCPPQSHPRTGCLDVHSVSRSYARATRYTVVSSKGLPMICMESGRPVEAKPVGRARAGFPVTLKGARACRP